jgi:hypothetical protein
MMTNHITFAQFCSAVLRNGSLALCLAVCTLGLGLSATAQTITTFDAPGAGTAAGQGTFGLGMTPSQAIEGFYIDGNGAFHGFLRASHGSSQRSTLPERAQALARVPSHKASTRRERSPATPLTPATYLTASRALPTVPLPPSTLLVQVDLAHVALQ